MNQLLGKYKLPQLTEYNADNLHEGWFSGDSDGKESACNTGDPDSVSGLRRSPWRRDWPPTPVFLPGEFHGQGSLVGYSPWGFKEQHYWATNFLNLCKAIKEIEFIILKLLSKLQVLLFSLEKNTNHLKN